MANKVCSIALRQSLKAYNRTKLLEAVEAKSSSSHKYDLDEQETIMTAFINKEGMMQTSKRVMGSIV